jgi:hypothetical protein
MQNIKDSKIGRNIPGKHIKKEDSQFHEAIMSCDRTCVKLLNRTMYSKSILRWALSPTTKRSLVRRYPLKKICSCTSKPTETTA